MCESEMESVLLRARVADLEELVVRLADRILAAHEVLANLAERRASPPEARR